MKPRKIIVIYGELEYGDWREIRRMDYEHKDRLEEVIGQLLSHEPTQRVYGSEFKTEIHYVEETRTHYR